VAGKPIFGEKKMNNLLLKLYVKFQDLKSREEGQDLVEYALVVALISFGVVAGLTPVSTQINKAYQSISSAIAANIT
jgi:Flp pilus assembly pilin Flp